MSEQNGQEQSNRTNRITLEDVAKALEALGITPAEASAGRIRTHLGRGSLTTIQRHLETLRGEQPSRQAMERRVLEEMKGLVPLLTALGESVVSGQYARLLDQYEEELGNAEATIEGLKAEVEALQNQNTALAATLEEQSQTLHQAIQEKDQTIEELRGEVARLTEALRNREETIRLQEARIRELEAAKEALGARIEALVDQLSTLKAAVIKGKEERDDEKPEAEGQGANPPLFGKGDAKPKP
ncbi:DNA-binding protein [Thermus sp. SYSU G05001]|uniref:DNA-binding protein n=2 Tax=Thermus TaxID=270 RepID=A0ABS7A1L8_9DEIN|nr:DNA-binding protein [Thermus brevis]MBW6396186.1 DNA-binding protein [Thermus brevis]